MPIKLLHATTITSTLLAFIAPIADHFRGLGWTVDGAAFGITETPEARAHFNNVWEVDWSRQPLAYDNIEAVSRIREIAADQAYDIVHVHTPVAGFLTRFALRQPRATSGQKVVYTAHGFHCRPDANPLLNGIFCGLERIAGLWADALVVINNEDERLARNLQLAKHGKLYYMPGIGVDLNRYSRANVTRAAIASIAEELGLRPEDKLFLMIAGFWRGKRHIDALRAFRLVWQPGVHLAFAGIGTEMEKVRKLASDLGLADATHFLGLRDDVPALLAASDALILPSEREGLSRSVMESMAMGTPVIGTRIRGISELLSDGAGLLVEVGDLQGFADAMRLIIDDPDAAQECVNRARRRIPRYALPRVIQLHEEMYLEMLASR